MRQHSFSSVRAWLVLPLVALGFALWGHGVRKERIEHIAELSRGESTPNDASPTGYAGGVRERVLPDHDNSSYEWIAQTQLMLATGDWRIRRIADENAPFGRETHAASPYRWYLGAVAAIHHEFTGSPIGISVERAAIYADPLLHLVFMVALVGFAAWRFGWVAAATVGIATAVFFPFASRFFPGLPDDSVFAAGCVLGSVLPILAGAREGGRRARLSFCIAGVFGGLGMWLNPASQAPVIVGIAVSAILIAALNRSEATETDGAYSQRWRLWSLSGATTVLVAYLAEYFPHHLGEWEIRAVHPVYGVAWIGLGELITWSTRWIQRRSLPRGPRDIGTVLLAVLAVCAVPIVMRITDNPGVLAVSPDYYRLLNQPGGIMASNIVEWFREEGLSRATVATFMPLLLIVPAFWIVAGRKASPGERAAIGLALGPVIMLLALACFQIRQWLLVDAALLALLIPTIHAIWSGSRPIVRWIWFAGLIAVLAPGLFQTMPARALAKDNVMSFAEALGLAERDLAHWLALRTRDGTPPLVLATPRVTTSLLYYGGLRGVATLSWENQDGLSFAIRTAISTSRNETAALLGQRGVTHIVMPSWDPFFDTYLQSASVQVGELFHVGLNNWALPPWLKAVPYELPSIPGFENQSVRIFERVDDQDPPTAAARLMEYFLEMGRLEHAKAYHQVLLKYPADLGVQIARAQLWAAVGDAERFSEIVEPLLGRISAGADRYLPWDRRVSLAIVLARGNQMEAARAQVQRCVADLNEARLRSLTTHSLYRLLAMNNLFGIEISDTQLRELAMDLLPAPLRKEL